MAGILSELESMSSINDVSLIGLPAYESEVVIDAIHEECSSDEEFVSVLESASTEMALFGVIDKPEIAVEAVKKIQVDNWKVARFNRIVARTAIRMAMINNDALYTKYKKYRDLLLEVRAKIYQKYGAKARVEAKKIIKNARAKAMNMTSATGKDVTAKIDSAIARSESGSKA